MRKNRYPFAAELEMKVLVFGFIKLVEILVEIVEIGVGPQQFVFYQ